MVIKIEVSVTNDGYTWNSPSGAGSIEIKMTNPPNVYSAMSNGLLVAVISDAVNEYVADKKRRESQEAEKE